ncbi:MAG: tail fiber domain-containing protein [Bacteroidota bacterium]
MKFYIYILLFIGSLFSTSLMGQSNEGFHFQAVVRDDAGNPIPNKAISLRFKIASESSNGVGSYVESHTIQTNSLGLVQATIGKGKAEQNTFDIIDWGRGNYYLQVEIDGEPVDTTFFQGVPYAKVATDMQLEELQNVGGGSSRAGDVLQWDGANWVPIAAEELEKGDADDTNEIQTLLFDQSDNSLRLSKVDGTISLDKFISPWQEADTSGRIFFPNRIGLGLSNPTAQLHIKDQALLKDDFNKNAYGQLKLSGTDDSGKTLTTFDGSADGNYWSMYTESASSSANFSISHNTIGNTFNINNQGNVGIGVRDPAARMEIIGPASDQGHLKLTADEESGSRLTFGKNSIRKHWYIEGRANAADDDSFFLFGFDNDNPENSIATNTVLRMKPYKQNKSGGQININGNIGIVSLREAIGLSNINFIAGETNSFGTFYGIYNTIEGTGFNSTETYNMVGVNSEAFGTASKVGLAVGVKGTAIGGKQANYGIWGSAGSNRFDYAVYADGNVFSTGSYLPSDRRLKKNVQPLKKGLEKVMALRPSSFQYDKQSRQHMSLPEGEQYGLIAQDVEALLPQLTKTSYHAYATGDSTARHEGFEFTAVNYVGLIPFLISATQEQQQTIESQKALLNKQEGIIEKLTGRLSQLEALVNTLSAQVQGE